MLLDRATLMGLILSTAGAVFVGVALQLRWLHPAYPVPPPERTAVLVTGASGGLGAEFAREFKRLGFVVFGTVRKQADLERLELEGLIKPVLFDVTSAEDAPRAVERVAAALQEAGVTLGALVNNAGITGTGTEDAPAELAGPELYEKVLATNVVGVARSSTAFLPLLVQHGRGARIVNIGSYFGEIAPGIGGLVPYVTSKHAVEGMSDGMRRTLSPQGIAVALIKPGDYESGMNSRSSASSDKSDLVGCMRDAVTHPRPQSRYYCGQVNGIPVSVLNRVLPIVPDWLRDVRGI